MRYIGQKDNLIANYSIRDEKATIMKEIRNKNFPGGVFRTNETNSFKVYSPFH